MTTPAGISATIDGRAVDRREVEQWESHRAAAVLKKMAARLGSRAFSELMPSRTVDTMNTDNRTVRIRIESVRKFIGRAPR